MTDIPDHYAALGIDPTADPEVITAAYRALAKKYHPDTGSTTGTASVERFDQIQKAYEVLRTPESRHAYDLELLEATEQELAEHIASKRRVSPYRGDDEADGPEPGDIDLGDIRPEPPRGRHFSGSARGKKPRSILPFVVPVVLLLAILGGAVMLFLPGAPEPPPLPHKSNSEAKAKVKPAAQKPAAPKPVAAAPAEKPLFGSSTSDVAVLQPETKQLPEDPGAAASDDPAALDFPDSAPVAPPAAQRTAAQPLFGSSVTDEEAAQAADAPAADAPAAEPLDIPQPPPTPKPRPIRAAGDAQPQRQAAAQGPYQAVIFERQPGADATAWRAGVVFDTEAACADFSIRAVQRRLANQDPEDGVKVWYECQGAGGVR